MARNTLLETDTVTLEQLFSNGYLYRVPMFQRDYAWDREQWSGLWEDILESRKTDFPHYMGALVLQRAPNQPYQVIDGQQRLATLVISCVAVLERLREMGSGEDTRRADLLRAQYVGSEDPGSLRWQSKLELNEADNAFFQEFIVNQKKPPAENRLQGSNRRLWLALKFFREQWLSLLPAGTSGEELVDAFRLSVGRQLAFTRITVDDELNAYSVFETLNARNLQLTSTDLLKNYLFSLLSGGRVDLDQARAQWARIVGAVEPEELPTFLRQFWLSKNKLVRAERLFRALKGEIRSREAAFELLDRLEAASIWYRALRDPHDELWTESADCKMHIRTLGMFGVSQHVPLLLACFSVGLDLKRIESVLRSCVTLFFRHNIIGRRNPSELEQRFNQVAMSVTAGELRSPQAVWNGVNGSDGLRELYVADDDFVEDFARAVLPTRGARAKIPKYVLVNVERQAGGLDQDFETSPATVEHVLPENPGAGWEMFGDEDRRRFTSRLGNYALLERHLNKAAGAAPFSVKVQEYQKSQFITTKSIHATAWTAQNIEERQRGMAEYAKTCWRVSFD
jgi:hypothetical protein